MTEPVFTPWLENTGTGKCPVPDWSDVCEVKDRDGDVDPVLFPEELDWKTHIDINDITHYRYAIPASLYHLVKTHNEWPMDWPERIDGWARVDWLKAREDLGFGSSFSREDLEKHSVREETNKTQAHSYVDGNGHLHIRVNEDPVNHPSHYMLAPGMEAIDVIRAALTPTEFMGYLKGSILKSRLQAGRKGDAEQDLAKADWYRNEAMKREEW